MTRLSDPARPGTSAARLVLRIAVVAGALLYGFAAVGSGLDRMARTDPRMIALVPEPFRANADRTAAQLQLATRNFAAMRDPAAAALRRDPLNPSSASLYGWSLFAEGKDKEATAAFKVAGGLGWRDPLTQIYWFAAAMQQQDYPVAAMRIDALLRQNPIHPQRDVTLARLEAIPEGRAALVERMKERPDWLEMYVADIRPPQPAMVEARAQTLLALGRSGTRLGCAGIARFVERLVTMGQLEQARAVRSVHCGSDAAGLLTDGSFASATPERPLTAFDWEIAADGSLDLTLVDAGAKGRTLRVSNGGATTRVFASQLLAAGPGRYRLSGRLSVADGGDAHRFGAALQCSRNALRQPLEGLAVAGGRFTASMTIPADCAMPYLALTAAPGAGYVNIGELALARE